MTEQTEMIGKEVATVEDGAVEVREPGGLTLIERLIDSGAGFDVEVVERLVALQERQEERAAERAMAEALAAFQAACPPIPKTGVAEVRKNGQLQYTYKYPKLEKTLEIIGPVLAEHGLSFVHDSAIEDRDVAVTCTLQHVMGATRTATFRAPVDSSGGKNPLQAVGSARSYGKRYTLFDVLGLADAEDDDGSAAGGADVETVTPAQLKRLNELADEAGADKVAFCRLMGDVESMAAIPANQFKLAEITLQKKLEKKEAASE